MSEIIEGIEKLENLRYVKGASNNDIIAAEKQLGISFANDYKDYLKKYGTIIAKNVELTGLNVSLRINVVNVTLKERELNDDFPEGMYVIENISINGILILQSESSEVYEFIPHNKLKKISNNLSEYILNL